MKTKAILSMITKALSVCSACAGLILCYFSVQGFMSGNALLLYFTNQSNIWIAVMAFALLIVQLVQYKKGIYQLSKKLYLLQEIFTVSITLTCVIYCFVLTPSILLSDLDFNPFSFTQMLLHVVTPVLAILDFVCFTSGVKFKTAQCFWAVIPPIYYLGFSIIGYFKNWDFGGGANYPYFFLNYASPAGVFGFSKVMPYFMGSFYWIIFLVVLVSAMSLAYIKIVNKKAKTK